MKKVVLISCAKKKLTYEDKAENLYISPLFRMNLAYSKILKADTTYILSAKYGLLSLEKQISPYDVTLNEMKSSEKQIWAQHVLGQLREREEIDDTVFVFLAGLNYRKYLIADLKYHQTPMEGMSIGRQMQFIKTKLKND
jgi:hypothetical protein